MMERVTLSIWSRVSGVLAVVKPMRIQGHLKCM
jgi:hypothetical protein